MAYARTGKTVDGSVEFMIKDIIDCFGDIKTKYIIEALKFGGRGEYGVTYSLTVQVVCIWIKKYLKEDQRNHKDYIQDVWFGLGFGANDLSTKVNRTQEEIVNYIDGELNSRYKQTNKSFDFVLKQFLTAQNER